LGGKWNKMLRGGEGWIFPLTKKSIVEQALSEPPTLENTNSNETSNTEQVKKNDGNIRRTQTTTSYSSSGSSEVVLTKKEYLHLISRIEKTEQLILRVDRLEKLLNIKEKQIDTCGNNNGRIDTSNKLPLLSNINENDLVDYDEEEEEEDRKVQPLLRKKKIVN
jgi:hypothetical protein